MNREKELFIEREGEFLVVEEPELTRDTVINIAELVAEHNKKSIAPTNPLLSATMPSGARCQFVLPPACEQGQIVFSIRKPSAHKKELKEWFHCGLIEDTNKKDVIQSLHRLHAKNRLDLLMEKAVLHKCNIVISGGTSTAKTTFLNSCLELIPLNERIITIEDVRETRLPHKNVVHLLASNEIAPSSLSHRTTMLDLLKASLRLRPDRIFLSELRGNQAYPFLRASISGHPGSMTTIHADSIEHAKSQLKFMLLESDELKGASDSHLNCLINSSVDVIVQMKREGSRRGPSEIYIRDIE